MWIRLLRVSPLIRGNLYEASDSCFYFYRVYGSLFIHGLQPAGFSRPRTRCGSCHGAGADRNRGKKPGHFHLFKLPPFRYAAGSAAASCLGYRGDAVFQPCTNGKAVYKRQPYAGRGWAKGFRHHGRKSRTCLFPHGPVGCLYHRNRNGWSGRGLPGRRSACRAAN